MAASTDAVTEWEGGPLVHSPTRCHHGVQPDGDDADDDDSGGNVGVLDDGCDDDARGRVVARGHDSDNDDTTALADVRARVTEDDEKREVCVGIA